MAMKGASKMSKSRFLLALIIMMVILPACSQARSSSPEMGMAPPMEVPAAGNSAGFGEESFSADVQSEVLPGQSPAQADRLVIKNGSLTIVVDDPVKTLDEITLLAEDLGGFVVSANMSEMILENGSKAPQASITIRIPSERFNEAMKMIKEESSQIPIGENISSQDVTAEYTDLASRLRNLEAAEAKLTEIMASAFSTEDVLSVYNQLVQVREQIEVIKGQMKYYEESAAMSAISINLLANAAVQPLSIGGWQPVGTARNAVQALINTLKTLGNLVIWVILYLLPVLLILYLIIVLPISLVWRAWRRSRSKDKAKVAPPAPPSTP
jgi:hypothetical protein